MVSCPPPKTECITKGVCHCSKDRKKMGRIESTQKKTNTSPARRSPTTTSSGRTMRILPTPSGSGDPSVLPLPRAARAANANANAFRTGDGVAGPAESAGDAGALSFPLPTCVAGAKARMVGSRRCVGEGVNTGAAGLSLVLVLNASAPESGDDFFMRARAACAVLFSSWVPVGPDGMRGALELGLDGAVSPVLLLLRLIIRRARFIVYVGQRVRQNIEKGGRNASQDPLAYHTDRCKMGIISCQDAAEGDGDYDERGDASETQERRLCARGAVHRCDHMVWPRN
jgi:hypothetical protein